MARRPSSAKNEMSVDQKRLKESYWHHVKQCAKANLTDAQVRIDKGVSWATCLGRNFFADLSKYAPKTPSVKEEGPE